MKKPGDRTRRTTTSQRAGNARAATPSPVTLRVLPMQLKPGDTITDEAGTWEIIGRPITQRGGKDVTVKVQCPGDPRTLREQWWPAYERVTVMRPVAT